MIDEKFSNLDFCIQKKFKFFIISAIIDIIAIIPRITIITSLLSFVL